MDCGLRNVRGQPNHRVFQIRNPKSAIRNLLSRGKDGLLRRSKR